LFILQRISSNYRKPLFGEFYKHTLNACIYKDILAAISMATLRGGGRDWAITKKNSAQEKVPKKYHAKQVTQKKHGTNRKRKLCTT